MVGKRDSAGNIAKTLLGISYAEILIKGLGSVNRRLLGAQAAANIVSCSITLKTSVVSPTGTTGRIVRAVTFNHVIFDERAARPTVQR